MQNINKTYIINFASQSYKPFLSRPLGYYGNILPIGLNHQRYPDLHLMLSKVTAFQILLIPKITA